MVYLKSKSICKNVDVRELNQVAKYRFQFLFATIYCLEVVGSGGMWIIFNCAILAQIWSILIPVKDEKQNNIFQCQ